MEANIHQNGFSQIIQSHNLALSNENKKGYLLASTRFGTYQSGGATVSSEGKIKISQVRGDDLIKDVDSIIAIKIDVEGFDHSSQVTPNQTELTLAQIFFSSFQL